MNLFFKKVTRVFRTQAENAYGYFAMRYGIGYGELGVDCTIRLDGSGQVVRNVKVEAFSQIKELDTFLLIPETSPPDSKWDIDLLAVRSLSPDFNISIANVLEQDGRLSAKLEISPQLGVGQYMVYELTERLPPRLYAVDLTAAELASRETPIDYFGWNVNRPTRSLDLAVYFPEDTKPDSYGFEVRYASVAPAFPSENKQHEEEKRIRPALIGPEGGRYLLKLHVDYPMIGLIYILSWKPLTTKSMRTNMAPNNEGSQHSKKQARIQYNIGVVRDLLENAFTAEDLKRFCQDHQAFRPVVSHFGPKSGLVDIAEVLIEYCQKRNLLGRLLVEIRTYNPSQYERLESRLSESVLLADNDVE